MTDATCIIDGCDGAPCNGRGWCWKHYTRWRRGRPMEDAPQTPLHEQLAAGLDGSGGPDSCWEWQGRRNPNGYGYLGPNSVHRLMGSMLAGRELSSDEHVCHRCDNPPCANPRHLFIGSATDNMRDSVDKGRHGTRYYWVPDEDVRWLYERRVSPDRIAELFGVDSIVVRRRVVEMGLPARRAGRPTLEQSRRADAALAEWKRRRHAEPARSYRLGLMVSRNGKGTG